MQVNQKRAKAAKSCFDFNKNQNKAYVTDDLECFADRGHAVLHARTLEDKTVDVFHRDGDEADFDNAASEIETGNANTVPDVKLAQKKAAGERTKEDFVKTPAKPKPAATPAKAKAAVAPKAEKPATAPKAAKAVAPKAEKPATAPKAAKAAAPKVEDTAAATPAADNVDQTTQA